jgi:hypothetical protein
MGVSFAVAGGWARAADPALKGDGYQWISAVVVAGPGLVAAGLDSSGDDPNAAVWISDHGSSWARIAEPQLAGPGAQGIHDLVIGGPGIVAVGFDGSSGDYDGAIWVSADGIAWDRVAEEAFDAPGEQEINAIIDTGAGLVAAGYDAVGTAVDAAVWVSRDGYEWRRIFDPALGGFGNQRISSLAKGPGGLVAAGTQYEPNDFGLYNLDARVWVSDDGESWSLVDDPIFGGPGWQFITVVVAGPEGFVAAGTHILGHPGADNDLAVWVSADGITWNLIDEPIFDRPRVQRISAMIHGPEGIIAVGYDTEPPGNRIPAVWRSADGTAWARVHDPALREVGNRWMNAVVFGGPGLVAAGGDGTRPVGDPAVWLFSLAGDG